MATVLRGQNGRNPVDNDDHDQSSFRGESPSLDRLFEEELAEESIGSVSAEGETQWRSKSANSEDTPKSDNVRNRPLYAIACKAANSKKLLRHHYK